MYRGCGQKLSGAKVGNAQLLNSELEYLRAFPALFDKLTEASDLASKYPDASVAAARKFVEELLIALAREKQVSLPGQGGVAQERLETFINRLRDENPICLTKSQADMAHAVRMSGNVAVHAGRSKTSAEAMRAVSTIRKLAVSLKQDLTNAKIAIDDTASAPAPQLRAIKTTAGTANSTSGQPREQRSVPFPASTREKAYEGPKSYSGSPRPPMLEKRARSITPILGWAAAAIVGIWLISQAIQTTEPSPIQFTNVTIARDEDNGRPVNPGAVFDTSPARVVLVANYTNGRAGKDIIQTSIWHSYGGIASRCTNLQISGANGWISCPAILSEGRYHYELAVNGQTIGTYDFNIVDRFRLARMITTAAISDQVRNGKPEDTRSFDAGSPVGIYLKYQNAQNDTISVRLTKDGDVTSSCRDVVLTSGSGDYYCDWKEVDPGARSFIVLIDAIQVGEYPFVVNSAIPTLPEQTSSTPSDASVQNGWLGIETQNVASTENMISESGGVEVVRVIQNSPAAVAGIVPGDVITEIYGRVISDTAKLHRYVADLSPGNVADLVIMRGGREITLQVTMGTEPSPALSPSATLATDSRSATDGPGRLSVY